MLLEASRRCLPLSLERHTGGPLSSSLYMCHVSLLPCVASCRLGDIGATLLDRNSSKSWTTQIAEKLSDLVGRKISFVNLPPEQLKQALLSTGIPDWSADALIDLQRLYREGGAATVTQEVERLLGRNRPAIPDS